MIGYRFEIEHVEHRTYVVVYAISPGHPCLARLGLMRAVINFDLNQVIDAEAGRSELTNLCCVFHIILLYGEFIALEIGQVCEELLFQPLKEWVGSGPAILLVMAVVLWLSHIKRYLSNRD